MCLVRASLSSPPSSAWHPPVLAVAPQLEPETGMGVKITPGMFGKDDGQIQWYGIIATTNMSRESWAQEGLGDPGDYLAVGRKVQGWRLVRWTISGQG